MYRIDTGRAVLTRPTEDPPSSPGYFTAGDPNTGNLPTQLSGAWCNAVQESIARSIEVFGGTMTKGAAGDTDLVSSIKNGLKQYSGYARSTQGLVPAKDSTYTLVLPFTAPFPGRVHASAWQNSGGLQPRQDSPLWSISINLSFNGADFAGENTTLSSYLYGTYLIAAGASVNIGSSIVTANPVDNYGPLTHYLQYNYVPWEE